VPIEEEEEEMTHTDMARNSWPRYKNILVSSFLELMVLPEDRSRYLPNVTMEEVFVNVGGITHMKPLSKVCTLQ